MSVDSASERSGEEPAGPERGSGERIVDVPMQRVVRQSLADGLAQRLAQLIHDRRFQAGDRLPAIAEMARQFGVGSPTVREALRKLEASGLLEIRHGAGVFVRRLDDALVVPNPAFPAVPTAKLLVDLLDARIAIEGRTAALAARTATPEQVEALRAILARGQAVLGEPAALARVNHAFHAALAEASGNLVLRQLLDVIGSLFHAEQRMVYDIHGACAEDHDAHLGILQAVADGEPELAAARMHAHLATVRDALRRWRPAADAPLVAA